MKEIHLIYNPTSGKGNAKAAFEKIKNWLPSQADLNLVAHATENIGHATSIARDLTSTGNPVTILVLGGDGTLNEVLNGINDFSKTTLGILPFGSGNDFVRAIKLGNYDVITLINEYVNHPKIKKIDYLLLNDKYRAINEVGLGMSAEVIGFRNKMKHFSPEVQYKIATFVRAMFWKSFDYTMKVDKGEAKPVKAMWFTINNGIAVGSGLITDPDAKVDDGLISISYVAKFPRITTLGALTKVKKGKITSLKQNVRFTCKEIDLDTNDVVVEFDGNLIEHQDHVNVKVVPGQINLLTL
ncbi:MAG: diacylglycerol/lipid kinase family protein [Mycoplasmoidaceae bacterium]